MSGFILDTNVLSETSREQPNPDVIAFLTGLDSAYILVLSIHELGYGIERLEPGTKRRLALASAIDDLVATFGDRILTLGEAEARSAAMMRAAAEKLGRTVHVIDSFIAATALVHGLTVETAIAAFKNLFDFVVFIGATEIALVQLVDPMSLLL